MKSNLFPVSNIIIFIGNFSTLSKLNLQKMLECMVEQSETLKCDGNSTTVNANDIAKKLTSICSTGMCI